MTIVTEMRVLKTVQTAIKILTNETQAQTKHTKPNLCTSNWTSWHPRNRGAKFEATPNFTPLPWKKNSTQPNWPTLDSNPTRRKHGKISFKYIRTPGKKYKQRIKVYTNGSKKDAVITPEWKTRKRIGPQNTTYSAKKEAIIKTIQSKKKDNPITDSFWGNCSTKRVEMYH
jgi:hypothetical protein